MRPVALGYLRLHAGDPPEVAVALTGDMQAYAETEHLTLADIYTDLFDPPADGPDRSGFCALMDALRRHDGHAVIIPAADHPVTMSRRLLRPTHHHRNRSRRHTPRHQPLGLCRES